MIKKDLLIWIIPKNNSIKYISKIEEESAAKLNSKKRIEFLNSRSYLRQILSNLFNMSPLEVPLHGQYGIIPYLPNKFGYISLSHCENATLIGWSRNKLGVDIEKRERKFNAEKLMNRYYFPKEQKKILKNNEPIRVNVMKYWVLKEASIKLQHGKIAKDLLSWEIDINGNKAYNYKLKMHAHIKNIFHEEWIIGIASDLLMLKKMDTIICNMI